MITFCINTSNNELDHLRLLFKSLELNLSNTNYDIIVFVDSDNQNTTNWLKSQKHTFKNLRIIKNPNELPIGYQRNINIMFEMAQTEIVSYLQSDMVISKNYDLDIIKNLDPNTIISSTRIEPPLHPASPEKITFNFGLDPNTFDFESFVTFAESHKQHKLTNYWFAPFTLYKKNWIDIGGHDTMFRRSREDSDILYRMCLNRINFKQDWNAIVYHFTCTSSRGKEWWEQKNQNRTYTQTIADQIEMTKFLRKWRTFKHDTNKCTDDYKYNVSINLKNTKNHENLILNNYFYFNKISIDDSSTFNILKTEFNKFDNYANSLFNIPDKTWDKYKHVYNTLKFDDIFTTHNISDDDVIIDLDLNTINDNTIIYLTKIQEIIHNSLNEYQSGTFTVDDNIIITIKSLINRIRENIIVNNPKFDLPLNYL